MRIDGTNRVTLVVNGKLVSIPAATKAEWLQHYPTATVHDKERGK